MATTSVKLQLGRSQPGFAYRLITLVRDVKFLGLIALLMITTVTGVFIVRDPVKACLIMGAVVMLVLLESSPMYWGLAAIFAATFSRLLVSVGAPHFLNFAHFPLVLGAFVVALVRGKPAPVAKPILAGISALLAINILSWLANEGEPMWPVLNWLVITEPFLLLYAFLVSPPTPRLHSLLTKILLGLGFIQVPFSLYERVFISGGNPDLVQGTFIGAGTGAHLTGAITMVGVLCLFSQAGLAKSFGSRTLCLAAAVPLLATAVIADAKQVIVAFVPGIIFALVRSSKFKLTALILPAVLFSVMLVAAFTFWPPLQKLGDKAMLSQGIEGKSSGLLLILRDMSDKPISWLVGVGPGNSVSRVAMLTPDASLDSTSSLTELGLKTAPLTKRIVASASGNYLSQHSSAWYPICSWFGIVGDLGFVGLGIYIWMLWKSWQTAGTHSWMSSASKGSIAAMILLGGVYSWLEEPNLTLVVAMLISLAAAAPRTAKVPILRRFAVSRYKMRNAVPAFASSRYRAR